MVFIVSQSEHEVEEDAHEIDAKWNELSLHDLVLVDLPIALNQTVHEVCLKNFLVAHSIQYFYQGQKVFWLLFRILTHRQPTYMHAFDIHCVNHDVFLVDTSFQEIEVDLLPALLLREFETIRPEGRHGDLNCRP